MIEGLVGVFMTKIFGPSWQTSIMGWVLFAYAVIGFLKAVLDGDPATVPDWDAVMLAAAGAGLIKARDKNVTSEQQLSGRSAPIPPQ